MDRFIFNPFTLLALLIFGGLVLLLLPPVFLGIIGTAFLNLGFSWREVLLILLAILAGSFMNIPITTLEGRGLVYREEYVPFIRVLYRIPLAAQRTTLAINVGGHLIPVLISLYLLAGSVAMTGSFQTSGLALLGIPLVSIVVHLTSRAVPGLGIVTPFFIAPLSTLFC
jgi:uncharacterized membrane protein